MVEDTSGDTADTGDDNSGDAGEEGDSPGNSIPRCINSSLLVLMEIFLSRPGNKH